MFNIEQPGNFVFCLSICDNDWGLAAWVTQRDTTQMYVNRWGLQDKALIFRNLLSELYITCSEKAKAVGTALQPCCMEGKQLTSTTLTFGTLPIRNS